MQYYRIPKNIDPCADARRRLYEVADSLGEKKVRDAAAWGSRTDIANSLYAHPQAVEMSRRFFNTDLAGGAAIHRSLMAHRGSNYLFHGIEALGALFSKLEQWQDLPALAPMLLRRSVLGLVAIVKPESSRYHTIEALASTAVHTKSRSLVRLVAESAAGYPLKARTKFLDQVDSLGQTFDEAAPVRRYVNMIQGFQGDAGFLIDQVGRYLKDCSPDETVPMMKAIGKAAQTYQKPALTAILQELDVVKVGHLQQPEEFHKSLDHLHRLQVIGVLEVLCDQPVAKAASRFKGRNLREFAGLVRDLYPKDLSRREIGRLVDRWRPGMHEFDVVSSDFLDGWDSAE